MGAPRIVVNDKIAAMLSPEDRKSLGVKTRDEIETKLEDKAEKVIQLEVEGWLRNNGFWPRTEAFLDGKRPDKGWYFHMYNAKQNPCLLDLLIMTLDGRVLELELKTRLGKLRPEQSVILNTTGCAKVARSTLEAIEVIKEWLEGEHHGTKEKSGDGK